MNKLSIEKQVQIISALVEGNSIRSINRMTGVSKVTILKLLKELGDACWAYHQENVKGLACIRVQCDEIWAYCYAKQKNVPIQFKGQFGYGDVWTFTAIDADTKLCVGWNVGERTTESAINFFWDLRHKIEGRFQISTDAFKGYEEAIKIFGSEVDYGVIKKVYGKPWYYQPTNVNWRYSPNACTSAKKTVMKGHPREVDICTSHVERLNLTMRMGMRRFTRLTNGFSKKVDNMKSAIALNFMNYNFCRVHQTIKTTPAMKAGLTDHAWTIEEVLNLMEKYKAKVA